MTRWSTRLAFATVLALALGPSQTLAAVSLADPVVELRAPAPLSESFQLRHAKLYEPLRPELQGKLQQVILTAIDLTAPAWDGTVSGHESAEGDDSHNKKLPVRKAVKKALVLHGFADITKRPPPEVEALVKLGTFALVHELHLRLGVAVSRGLAIRAMLACKGKLPCIDGLTAKGDMRQQELDEVRKQFKAKPKDLEAQDRELNFQIQRLMSAFNEAEAQASSTQKKSDDGDAKLISKI